jgi:hypothetical protein
MFDAPAQIASIRVGSKSLFIPVEDKLVAAIANRMGVDLNASGDGAIENCKRFGFFHHQQPACIGQV